MSIFHPNNHNLHGSTLTLNALNRGVPVPPIVTNSNKLCKNLFAERSLYCESSGNIKSSLLEIVNQSVPGYVLTGIDSTHAKWDSPQNATSDILNAIDINALNIHISQNAHVFGDFTCKGNIDCSSLHSSRVQSKDVLCDDLFCNNHTIHTDLHVDDTIYTCYLDCEFLEVRDKAVVANLKAEAAVTSDFANGLNSRSIANNGLPGQVLTLLDDSTMYWEDTDTGIINSNEIRTKLLEVEDLVIHNDFLVPNLFAAKAHTAINMFLHNQPHGKAVVSDSNGQLSLSNILLNDDSILCKSIQSHNLFSHDITINNTHVSSNSKNRFVIDHIDNLGDSQAHFVSCSSPLHINGTGLPNQVLTSTIHGPSWENIHSGVNPNSFKLSDFAKTEKVLSTTLNDSYINRFSGKPNHKVILPPAKPGMSFVIWNAGGGTLTVLASDQSTIAVMPGGGSNRVITFTAFKDGGSANVWGRISDIVY